MLNISNFLPIKCTASDTRLSEEDLIDIYVAEGIGKEGDLVLVEALEDAGAYCEVENMQGRSMRIFKGQRFVGVLGNRESSKNIVGGIDEGGIKIDETAIISLLTNGGIVGTCYDSPTYMGDAMKLKCIGLLKKENKTINTLDKLKDAPTQVEKIPPIILVAGTATDAGKTTIASKVISYLANQGYTVAGTKLAGTGCLEDVLAHKDAGATYVMDFPDAGLPSTYTSESNYQPGIRLLLQNLANKKPDFIVAELGGDIIWANIPTLFKMSDIMEFTSSLLLVSSDAISTIAAYKLLEEWGFNKDTYVFNSPFKNNLASQRRLQKYLNIDSYDSTKIQDVHSVVKEIVHQNKISV
ncbi:hypothetical protein [Priestia megaterium]|uniref:nucleotide-binding protein n=1 Tax=Priestia megaterium TaxID=1404 RepID=UPI00207A7935|nr:hypothetical protein [Priestia megaterium]USL45556.1 hypothetical protein LIS78_29610 [Priestia megaterium]